MLYMLVQRNDFVNLDNQKLNPIHHQHNNNNNISIFLENSIQDVVVSPRLEVLNCYDNFNNYFVLFQSIVKIQSVYRMYKAYKNFISYKNTMNVNKVKAVKKTKSKNLTKNTSINNDTSFLSINNNNNNNTDKPNPTDIKIKGHFLLKTQSNQIYKDNTTRTNFCIIKYKDNSKLLSKFTNNEITGWAKFINSQYYNSLFSGYYISNHPDGYGIYIDNKNSVIYEGIWKDNELNGIGTEIWKDETYYRGEYVNSKKHGIGMYRWPDGTLYQGEWENDQMTGYGAITYSDEGMYTGQVVKGLMDGYGEFSWRDGKKYIGEYSNNIKNGFGVFVWNIKSFDVFIGFWMEGKMDGPGVKIKEDMVSYGYWKMGCKTHYFSGPWEIDEYLDMVHKKLPQDKVQILKMDVTKIKHFLKKFYMNN